VLLCLSAVNWESRVFADPVLFFSLTDQIVYLSFVNGPFNLLKRVQKWYRVIYFRAGFVYLLRFNTGKYWFSVRAHRRQWRSKWSVHLKEILLLYSLVIYCCGFKPAFLVCVYFYGFFVFGM
jgi:hypothetical protein